jgi:hypothetical protein
MIKKDINEILTDLEERLKTTQLESDNDVNELSGKIENLIGLQSEYFSYIRKRKEYVNNRTNVLFEQSELIERKKEIAEQILENQKTGKKIPGLPTILIGNNDHERKIIESSLLRKIERAITLYDLIYQIHNETIIIIDKMMYGIQDLINYKTKGVF